MVYDPIKSYQITEKIRKGQEEVKKRKEIEKALREGKDPGISYYYQGMDGRSSKDVTITYEVDKNKNITKTTTTKTIPNEPMEPSTPKPQVSEFQYQPQKVEQDKTVLQQGNKNIKSQAIQQKLAAQSEINKNTQISENVSYSYGTKKPELKKNYTTAEEVKTQRKINERKLDISLTDEESYMLSANKISSDEDILLPLSNRAIQNYKLRGSSEYTTKGAGFNDYENANKRQQEFFDERAAESGMVIVGSLAAGYGGGVILSAFPEAAAVLGVFGLYQTGKSVKNIIDLSKTKPGRASYEAQKLGIESLGAIFGGSLGASRFFKFTGGRSGRDYFNQEIRPNIDINVLPKVKQGVKTVFEVTGDVIKEVTPTDMFMSKRASIGGKSAKYRAGKISKGELRKGKEYRTFRESSKQDVTKILRENKVNINNINYIKDSRNLNKARVEVSKGLIIENKIKSSPDILVGNLERIRSRNLPISPNIYPQKNIKIIFKGKRTAYGRPKLELNIENSLGKPIVTSKIVSSYESGFKRLKYTPKTELKVIDTPSGSLNQINKLNYKSVKLSSSKPPKKITKTYEDITIYGRSSDKNLKSRNDLYNKEIPISSATVKTIELPRKGFRSGQFNKLKERIEYKENINKLPSSESTKLFTVLKEKPLTIRQNRIKIRDDSRTARFDFERNSKNTLKFIPERRNYNYEQTYPRGKLDFITERATEKHIYPKNPKPQKSTELSRVDLSKTNYVKTVAPEYERPVLQIEQARSVGEVSVLPKKSSLNEKLLESSKQNFRVGDLGTKPEKVAVFTPMQSNLNVPEVKVSEKTENISDVSRDLDVFKESNRIQERKLDVSRNSDFNYGIKTDVFKETKFKNPKPRKPIRPNPYVPDFPVPKPPIIDKPIKPPKPQPPNPKIPDFPVPKPPIIPNFPQFKKTRESKNAGFFAGFGVKVKRGGKYRVIATGLTESEAIREGKRYTDINTSRTFKLFKSGTVRREKQGIIDLNRYRRSKHDPFAFVEMNKFAISTGGERRELRQSKKTIWGL